MNDVTMCEIQFIPTQSQIQMYSRVHSNFLRILLCASDHNQLTVVIFNNNVSITCLNNNDRM